jgi:hypothetical protein
MSQPVHELLSEAEVEALFVGVTTALCVTIILDGLDTDCQKDIESAAMIPTAPFPTSKLIAPIIETGSLIGSVLARPG